MNNGYFYEDYQLSNADKGAKILKELNIVYFGMEVRVRKTSTSFYTIKLNNYKKALFVTKKKAISSIKNDFKMYNINYNFEFELDVINYESLHKIEEPAQYDVVVIDEAHSIGAYPKPSKRTKLLKQIVKDKPLILMSGTPSPESESQLYHQFWVSSHSPFKEYKTFYKWAKEYVNVKEMRINGYIINNYDAANKVKIDEILKHYFLTFSQKQAGFKHNEVIEDIIKVRPLKGIQALMKRLVKDRYYKFKDGSEVLCDTAAKLQSKLHQVSSGTIKTEDGKHLILDNSKAEYIKTAYSGERIAIFYKFIAEGEVLKKSFPKWTDDPMKFHSGEYDVFISQIQSGSMGVDLSSADYLLFYNIDFSATQYWQARARIQNLKREKPALLDWIFSEGGIEEKVLTAVQKKKDYTLRYFKKDFGVN